MRELDPFFLRDLVIRGFDEGGDDNDDDNNDDDNNDDSNEDDDNDNSDDGKGGEDVAGLKSALDKERKARKRLDKENKRIKAEAASQNASDLEKAQNQAKENATKAEKLAAALRNAALDNIITKLAIKQKFLDTDDALRLINRDDIDVEQDEDEPDQVDIDEKSVETALKKLVTSKPHLVGDGKPAGSGSKFGGKGKNESEEDNDKALRAKYPALRRAPI